MGETIHGDWGDFIILKNVQMLLRINLKDGTRDCPINNSIIGDEQAYLKVARSPTKQPAASLMSYDYHSTIFQNYRFKGVIAINLDRTTSCKQAFSFHQ